MYFFRERKKKAIKARDSYGLILDRVRVAIEAKQKQALRDPTIISATTSKDTEVELSDKALLPYQPNGSPTPTSLSNSNISAIVPVPPPSSTNSQLQLIPKKAPSIPKPKWHAPWKLYRVISGHLGWVRCAAVEPGNEWFATGAADRVIKIWDLASGKLKLSLTGHVSTVRGLAVSPKHPYLFSCGEDRQVKCWDLEYNKVWRGNSLNNKYFINLCMLCLR